ncbi:MAG: hypothetical protein Q9N67_10540 [Ghiorsea sp.]|nr:hypothetical protein [Ghiorsea sp.]
MIKYIFPVLFFLAACSESIEPIKLEKSERTAKPYEQNAIDAAGVAEGKEQVSPNGRPAY